MHEACLKLFWILNHPHQSSIVATHLHKRIRKVTNLWNLTYDKNVANAYNSHTKCNDDTEAKQK